MRLLYLITRVRFLGNVYDLQIFILKLVCLLFIVYMYLQKKIICIYISCLAFIVAVLRLGVDIILFQTSKLLLLL